MSKALEATAETLGLNGDEEKRRAIAKFIVRLAQGDDSLDAAALYDRAVTALGGVEFLAARPISRSSNPNPMAE